MRTFAYGALAALVLGAAGLSTTGYAADPATARLQAPVSEPRKVIVDGRLWSCRDEKCTSGFQGKNQPIGRECARAAKVLGPIAEYSRGARSLDAKGIAACNAQVETARAPSGSDAAATVR